NMNIVSIITSEWSLYKETLSCTSEKFFNNFCSFFCFFFCGLVVLSNYCSCSFSFFYKLCIECIVELTSEHFLFLTSFFTHVFCFCTQFNWLSKISDWSLMKLGLHVYPSMSTFFKCCPVLANG